MVLRQTNNASTTPIMVSGSEREIEILVEDQRAELGAYRFGKRAQIDRLWVGQAGFRVEAGQLQHLINQVRGAAQTALQLAERTVAFVVIAGAQGNL